MRKMLPFLCYRFSRLCNFSIVHRITTAVSLALYLPRWKQLCLNSVGLPVKSAYHVDKIISQRNDRLMDTGREQHEAVHPSP